jgi:hypothetical protein
MLATVSPVSAGRGGRARNMERELRRAAWLYRVCIRAGGSPANCSDDANAHP